MLFNPVVKRFGKITPRNTFKSKLIFYVNILKFILKYLFVSTQFRMVSIAVRCLRNIKISVYKSNSILYCCTRTGAKLCFHEVKLQAERV
jgi:hypothetical protein